MALVFQMAPFCPPVTLTPSPVLTHNAYYCQPGFPAVPLLADLCTQQSSAQYLALGAPGPEP